MEDSENVEHRQEHCYSKCRFLSASFAHASRENAGDMKTGVCRKEGTTMLLAEEKTGHKHPVNPKNYRKNPPFNTETEVSIRIKRISNLSVFSHCFGGSKKD